MKYRAAGFRCQYEYPHATARQRPGNGQPGPRVAIGDENFKLPGQLLLHKQVHNADSGTCAAGWVASGRLVLWGKLNFRTGPRGWLPPRCADTKVTQTWRGGRGEKLLRPCGPIRTLPEGWNHGKSQPAAKVRKDQGILETLHRRRTETQGLMPSTDFGLENIERAAGVIDPVRPAIGSTLWPAQAKISIL